MSPNDPRVKQRQYVLSLAGYETSDNGNTYRRRSFVEGSRCKYETAFPYNRFYVIDGSGNIIDAWDQFWP